MKGIIKMKIKINTEIIKALKPCGNRYVNYLLHYKDFEGDIQDFLLLDKISHSDKLWVTLRLVPRIIVETFAIDCASAAADYAAYAAADADYAAADAADYAADAAANAAYYAASAAADYAAYAAADADYAGDAAADAVYAAAYAASAEKERQLCALEYLIMNHEEGE